MPVSTLSDHFGVCITPSSLTALPQDVLQFQGYCMSRARPDGVTHPHRADTGSSTSLRNSSGSPCCTAKQPESHTWLETHEVPTATSLKHFFPQVWVNDCPPKMLFIHRAQREGDRWALHVAFPVGDVNRDIETKMPKESDYDAAVRETLRKNDVLTVLVPEVMFFTSGLFRIMRFEIGTLQSYGLHCPIIYFCLHHRRLRHSNWHPMTISHWVPLSKLQIRRPPWLWRGLSLQGWEIFNIKE
ncbi:hypothetical protein BJ742DRAFT_792031 [Cladochytrium replicatum]|nr:hypothetical protein BJ742DRAFT_792031 [Cladochytrium replicatum]